MAELDLDRIAAAGLAVVDDKGTSGFTMRAVAEVLDVTPMALYHHVADKAALAEAVVDAGLAQHPLPPPVEGSWQDDLLTVARWLRDYTQSHPARSELRREYRIRTPAVFALTERWIRAWRRSGLDEEAVARAVTVSGLAILGVVEEEMVLNPADMPDPSTAAPDLRWSLRRQRDRAADFDLLVRSLIDGLLTELRSGA